MSGIKGYISIREASCKWGVSERRVNQYRVQGRIPELSRFGRSWAIPVDTEKPSAQENRLKARRQTMLNRNISRRALSIAAFSLFSVLLLSFAYEGQILYALLAAYTFDSTFMIPGAIICHAIGLFLCGFIVKSPASARKMMLISMAVCLVGSGVFFLPPLALWTIALFAATFCGGALERFVGALLLAAATCILVGLCIRKAAAFRAARLIRKTACFKYLPSSWRRRTEACHLRRKRKLWCPTSAFLRIPASFNST